MSDELDPDINNRLREGVLVAIKQTPEVGALLSFLVGLLWAEQSDPQKIWDEIKHYAEQMVRDALDKQIFETMERKLKSHLEAAKFYTDEPYTSNSKGDLLNSLIMVQIAAVGDFTNRDNLRQTFTLFTAFSTLLLSALAERAFHYEKVFKEPDKDATLHLRQFEEKLEALTETAQEMYDQLYEWRFSQLALTEWQSFETTKVRSTWTFTDAFDTFTRNASGEDWSVNRGFHAPEARARMQQVFDQRVAEINAGYVESLQSMLAVARLWRYLDPRVERPKTWPVVSPSGIFGGDYHRVPGAAFAASAPATARLSAVRLHHDEVVEGLEVFYDGTRVGAYGNCGGGKTVSTLELAPDETIVEVSGRAGDFINQLVLLTSKGRTVAGGQPRGGEPFVSRGQTVWKDATLFALDGRADTLRIVELALRWRHAVEWDAYVPAYKRKGSPLTQGMRFVLKDGDGLAISSFKEEYSGADAAYEYYPHAGKSPVVLTFGPGAGGAEVKAGMKLQLVTTETGVGVYSHLGKYRPQLYYYKPSGSDEQQWEISKLIPSDGPVIVGEKVYLRNAAEQSFLYPTEDGYLGAGNQPYAWIFAPS